MIKRVCPACGSSRRRAARVQPLLICLKCDEFLYPSELVWFWTPKKKRLYTAR